MPTPNSDIPAASGVGASTLSQAKGRATEVGQKAANVINENRGVAADKLDSAASALHERAENLPGGERIVGAAHAAADAMGTAASYVRDNDLKGMLADVQQLVKNNPVPALLTAAALGFLIARTVSRD